MFQSCLWGPVNLGRCQLNWSSTHLKICMGVQFDSGCVMNMTKHYPLVVMRCLWFWTECHLVFWNACSLSFIHLLCLSCKCFHFTNKMSILQISYLQCVSVCVCMRACVHACMHVCKRVCMCVCVCECLCVWLAGQAWHWDQTLLGQQGRNGHQKQMCQGDECHVQH